MLTDEQIHQMVMAKYPKSIEEFNCRTYRQTITEKRELYRKRLRDDNLLNEAHKENETLRSGVSQSNV